MREIWQTIEKALSAHIPPPPMTVVEWSEKNLYLARGTTAKPGAFKAWPWQREVLNSLTDDSLSSCVIVWPSQRLGKTLTIGCMVGYCIDYNPCPILIVGPTVENIANYSKTKLTPLILDSPVLSKLVSDEDEKLSRKGAGQTAVAMKRFSGGYIILAGANASGNIRSHSVRFLALDEVSAFADSVANEEGSPLWLAQQRVATFSDSFTVISSTRRSQVVALYLGNMRTQTSENGFFAAKNVKMTGRLAGRMWNGERTGMARPEKRFSIILRLVL